MEKNKFTHGSLFSGIGGPEIAAEEMGWKNMFHCEINPFGRKILDYWFPNSKSYEDITKTNFTEWPRGKRLFGADELDAELCIKDGMNYQIAEIHLGDVESSNILCEEIARRWNEHEEWHECKEDTEDVPPIGTYCILRVEYLCCSNKWKVDYLTAYYNKYGWTEDYLDQITCNYKDYKITHWKPINKPKGVEE